VGWQRARTRLILSLDLGSDEHAQDAYGVRTFVELERSLSVGAEFGYVRWVIPELNFFFGAVAVLAPETLFGGRRPPTIRSRSASAWGCALFTSLSVLPLGSDRPGDGVVMWWLLGIGIRGRL
jgi:hypothetical protein